MTICAAVSHAHRRSLRLQGAPIRARRAVSKMLSEHGPGGFATQGVAQAHRHPKIYRGSRCNAHGAFASRYKIDSEPALASTGLTRGMIMLIVVKRVPLAIRSDIVIACLRACVWAQVEGRPFCLIAR